MNIYWEAALFGTVVGAGGTLLGTSAALAAKSPKRGLASTLLALAGGLIAALVLLDMLPEAWEEGSPLFFFTGLGLGITVLWLISALSGHGHHHVDALEGEALLAAPDKTPDLVRTGILLALSMSVHNLPQGIAIGSDVAGGEGAALLVLLFLHNIPEGMSMALPLRIGGYSAKRVTVLALLTAVPVVAGALIGCAVSSISHAFIAAVTAFAGGAMLFLTLSELIPQAARLGSRRIHTILAVAGGFAAGGAVVWVLG